MTRTASMGLALLVLGGLCGCTDRKADEWTITQGEKVWGGAYVTSDVKAVERLLADDFVGIEPTGESYDKAQALNDVRHGPASTTSDVLGPVTVRFYGNTAVAQGSETGTEGLPDRKPFARVWTDVWVRKGGQWRIVAAQDLDPTARPPAS